MLSTITIILLATGLATADDTPQSYSGKVMYVEPGRDNCWIYLDNHKAVAVRYGEPYTQLMVEAALTAAAQKLPVRIEYLHEKQAGVAGDWAFNVRVCVTSDICK